MAVKAAGGLDDRRAGKATRPARRQKQWDGAAEQSGEWGACLHNCMPDGICTARRSRRHCVIDRVDTAQTAQAAQGVRSPCTAPARSVIRNLLCCPTWRAARYAVCTATCSCATPSGTATAVPAPIDASRALQVPLSAVIDKLAYDDVSPRRGFESSRRRAAPRVSATFFLPSLDAMIPRI